MNVSQDKIETNPYMHDGLETRPHALFEWRKQHSHMFADRKEIFVTEKEEERSSLSDVSATDAQTGFRSLTVED